MRDEGLPRYRQRGGLLAAMNYLGYLGRRVMGGLQPERRCPPTSGLAVCWQAWRLTLAMGFDPGLRCGACCVSYPAWQAPRFMFTPPASCCAAWRSSALRVGALHYMGVGSGIVVSGAGGPAAMAGGGGRPGWRLTELGPPHFGVAGGCLLVAPRARVEAGGRVRCRQPAAAGLAGWRRTDWPVSVTSSMQLSLPLLCAANPAPPGGADRLAVGGPCALAGDGFWVRFVFRPRRLSGADCRNLIQAVGRGAAGAGGWRACGDGRRGAARRHFLPGIAGPPSGWRGCPIRRPPRGGSVSSPPVTASGRLSAVAGGVRGGGRRFGMPVLSAAAAPLLAILCCWKSRAAGSGSADELCFQPAISMETSMPYVNIRITRSGASAAQRRSLIAG